MTEFNSKIKKNSRILKIFMFSICALFACAISSHAQSLVKGTVTDGIGEPLPGVSVVVKGTTNGTITDVNGKYSIQATAKDILSFSYVGMSDQEIKVAGQTTINVVMKDDVAALDEVIVVGYGTAKKQSLTGAVSAVKGDELLKAPATNVSSLLGGRLPGISSVQVSGEPGDDQATLRVRGSIYNVTYIVDGMPRSINDIDPNDIESVSVLKDGASAAVYGLKGAGGVIIITTKKGQEGKSKITYNGSIGASMNANFPQFMNGPQFAYYYNMADMMDKMANGSISNISQYNPVFTKANVKGLCHVLCAIVNGRRADVKYASSESAQESHERLLTAKSGNVNYETFAKREREVMGLCSLGFTSKEIGIKLGIGEPTVKTYIRRVMKKLGAKNRTQAVIQWMEVNSREY